MSRLDPVPARSAGPMTRLAYWYTQRRFGKVPEPYAVMAHAPAVFWVTSRFELAVGRRWRKVPLHLRELALMRASLTIDCPWCVDFGEMLSLQSGLPADKLAALPDWRTSDRFDELERLVLDYAEAMSETPLRVTDEMVHALREHLSEQQVMELTAYIALENSRSRINAALGIEAQGYSTGTCKLPATASSAAG